MRALAFLVWLCLGCTSPQDVAVLQTGDRAVVFGEHLLLGVRGGATEVEVAFAYGNDGRALAVMSHGAAVLLGDGPFCEIDGFLEVDFLTITARTATTALANDCLAVTQRPCTARCDLVTASWNLL